MTKVKYLTKDLNGYLNLVFQNFHSCIQVAGRVLVISFLDEGFYFEQKANMLQPEIQCSNSCFRSFELSVIIRV
jgi:hypothetical protein